MTVELILIIAAFIVCTKFKYVLKTIFEFVWAYYLEFVNSL